MLTLQKTLSDESLVQYVCHQLNTFFPDGHRVTEEAIHQVLPVALKRLEYCFSHVNNKYFFDGKNCLFNHLHGDQYAMFLYILSNEAYRQSMEINLCSKLFLLNKMLHSIDAFYEVELPDVFLFVHPLGTVLGRAQYSNYFLVYQRCGVGSNHDIYPEFKEFATLRPGASVLGQCCVESNCTIATESLLLDTNLSPNSVYIGNPKSFSIRTDNQVQKIWRV